MQQAQFWKLWCAITTIPILQMRKLRRREVKPLTKLSWLFSGWAGVQMQAAWLWHLCPDHIITSKPTSDCRCNYLKTYKWLLLSHAASPRWRLQSCLFNLLTRLKFFGQRYKTLKKKNRLQMEYYSKRMTHNSDLHCRGKWLSKEQGKLVSYA